MMFNCINETFQDDNIGTLLFKFYAGDRRLIRRIEGFERKRINAQYAVIFNETYMRENLLPTFTNIRTYARAVQQNERTLNFRKSFLKDETEEKKKLLLDIKQRLEEAFRAYQDLKVPDDLRRRTDAALKNIVDIDEQEVKTRVLKKLASLYGGQVNLPERRDSFINLSAHELTQDKKDLLRFSFSLF